MRQKNSKWGVPFPKLPAYSHNEAGHGIAWCEYCCRYHRHGNTTGHKNPHCTEDGSPYKSTGYVLVHKGKAPEWMLKDALRKSPYGKPESDGLYEHFLPTLTGKRTDPIYSGSRRMPTPKKKEAWYKMWLPFGKWVCNDGREVLFNCYNEPIWERSADGDIKLANPHATPEDIVEELNYYTLAKPPYDNKNVMRECMSVLNDFGIYSQRCNIPENFVKSDLRVYIPYRRRW